jgi:O-antigen/teichoic acid export membrane protein
MRLLRRIALIALVPLPVLAQVAGEQDSLQFALRAAIGFFGMIALLVFGSGFATYITRLGTERREDGIKIMEKGLSIFMVVVVATGVLYWLEK